MRRELLIERLVSLVTVRVGWARREKRTLGYWQHVHICILFGVLYL